MSEKNGIVKLENLPKKEVFIELDNTSKNILINKIKEFKPLTKFLKENKINCWFWDWWSNKKSSFLRLDAFMIMSKILGLEDIKISALRGKQITSIKNPKLPFDFTTASGVKFVAFILGDGCVHERGIRYYNSNIRLINNFIKISKDVFGSIRIKRYRHRNGTYIISLPKICAKIIEKVGIPSGSKVNHGMRIPNFVFGLKKDRIMDFISTFIDDEGSIVNGHITIDLAFVASKKPEFLYDFQKLLKIVGIKKSSIFPIRMVYPSSRGPSRKMWRIGIYSYKDVETLCSKLKLKVESKMKRSQNVLKFKRREFYRNDDIYYQKMKEIEMFKGFFTINDLAKTTKRSTRHSRRIIIKFRKSKRIRIFEPHRSSRLNPHITKYVVS